MKVSKKKVYALLALVVLALSPLSISISGDVPSIAINQAEALTLPCETGALGLGDLGCQFGNAILTYYELIFYATTQIFVVIAGVLMDVILSFSISSNFYRGSGMIEAGWEILRDLTNILLIFALLVSAFRMVLGQNDGKAKKTLMKTILIALVVNFSLFMSYAVIDGSNILAHVFYNRIDADVSNYENNLDIDRDGQPDQEVDAGGINLASLFRETEVNKSVSLAIAAQINPQRIINGVGDNLNQNGSGTNFLVGFILITGMAVMNIFLIYVFLSITLTFLGRILGLLVLAIMAPLAMVSIAVPGLRGVKYVGWDHWFPEILKLSFTAPIFLFFLWLTVTFVTNKGVLNTIALGGDNWLYVIINTYLLLFLIGGMLFLSKKITQSMAGDLGNLATKTVQGAIGGTIAAGAIAVTGGSAAVGMGLRAGGAVSNVIKKGSGKGAIEAGKQLMSFKTDVTKLPFFKSVAGDSATKMIGKVTGKSALGYADERRKQWRKDSPLDIEYNRLKKNEDDEQHKKAVDDAKGARRQAEAPFEGKLYQATMTALKSRESEEYQNALRDVEEATTAVKDLEKKRGEYEKTLKDSNASDEDKETARQNIEAIDISIVNAKADLNQEERILEGTQGYQDQQEVTRITKEKKDAGDAAEKRSREASAEKHSNNPTLANRILNENDKPKEDKLSFKDVEDYIKSQKEK